MRVNCKITIPCNNSEEACLINSVLEIDNVGYVECTVEENVIIATIESESTLSLLNTINDFLSCFTVAKDGICASREKRERDIS